MTTYVKRKNKTTGEIEQKQFTEQQLGEQKKIHS